jgi:hypothetical protein
MDHKPTSGSLMFSVLREGRRSDVVKHSGPTNQFRSEAKGPSQARALSLGSAGLIRPRFGGFQSLR